MKILLSIFLSFLLSHNHAVASCKTKQQDAIDSVTKSLGIETLRQVSVEVNHALSDLEKSKLTKNALVPVYNAFSDPISSKQKYVMAADNFMKIGKSVLNRKGTVDNIKYVRSDLPQEQVARSVYKDDELVQSIVFKKPNITVSRKLSNVKSLNLGEKIIADNILVLFKTDFSKKNESSISITMINKDQTDELNLKNFVNLVLPKRCQFTKSELVESEPATDNINYNSSDLIKIPTKTNY